MRTKLEKGRKPKMLKQLPMKRNVKLKKPRKILD